MTQSLETRAAQLAPAVIGFCRIVLGTMWAQHGASKLFGWPARSTGREPFGSWPYWWAGVIELVVGILLILGLFAIPAALVAAGTMAFAYFTEHQPTGLLPLQNGGELAVLYGIGFLLLAVVGPGAFALRLRRT